MKEILLLVVQIAACLVLGLISLQVLHEYLLLCAALCRRPGAGRGAQGGEHRFLVLVPAHNESAVIGYLIDSIRRCAYPSALLQTVVIADNCTDDTPLIARNAGALALERHDEVKRGKAFAISWALGHPAVAQSRFDAIVIFDADNVVHPDFFLHADRALTAGAKAFQGVVETKNRLDSWVCAGNYVMFAMLNRITQAGRDRLGLGVHLFGTGMGFTRELLDEAPWDAQSLTEDKEYTYRLLLKGIKVVWLEEGIVYDEKTVTAKQSFNQQSRWLSGYFNDFRKFAPLLLQQLRRKFDWSLLDALYHLAQPLTPGKNLASLLMLPVLNKPVLWIWWGVLFAGSYLLQFAALALNKTRIAEYRFLLYSFPFRLLALLVSIKTLLSGPDRTWRHTKHTQGIGMEDID